MIVQSCEEDKKSSSAGWASDSEHTVRGRPGGGSGGGGREDFDGAAGKGVSSDSSKDLDTTGWDPTREARDAKLKTAISAKQQ